MKCVVGMNFEPTPELSRFPLSGLCICLAGLLLPVAVGCGRTDSRSMGSQVKRFEELNFEFLVPGRPWVSINPGQLNSDAALALRRDGPEIYFMVVAEKATTELKIDTTHLMAIVCRNLDNAVSESSVMREYPRRINGLNGIQFTTDVTIGGHSLVYQHWVCSHKGYFYQLLAFGDSVHRAVIGQEAELLSTYFSFIDSRQ